MQVSIADDSLEIRLGIFLVAEVDQTVEIEEQVIIVHRQFALEPVLLHGTVQLDFINMIAKEMRIGGRSVKIELRPALLGESGRKIGIQVDVAQVFRGIGHHARLHIISIDVARKHVVALSIARPSHRRFNVANARYEVDIGYEMIV